MPQAIERRRHDEQMHRVAVIEHEVVETTAADPSGIAQLEPEPRIRRCSGSVVTASRRAACRHSAHNSTLPPTTTCCPGTRCRRRRAWRPRRRCGRASGRGVDRLAGAKPRLSRHRRHDADEAGGEQQHQREQRDAKAGVHRECRLRQRRHRHRQRALAAIAGDGDAHLPGTRAHQPEMTGVQPRILGGSLGTIGHRRKSRARPGQRQRHDPHVANVIARRQHLDVRDARNGIRRPHRDEQSIRSGDGLNEDVGAADVRGGRQLPRRDRQQQGEDWEAAMRRRRTCVRECSRRTIW